MLYKLLYGLVCLFRNLTKTHVNTKLRHLYLSVVYIMNISIYRNAMATKTTIFVNYTQLEPINRSISLKEMIVFYRHILAPTIGHLIGY